MLLGLTGGVTGVSLFCMFSFNFVVQAFGFYVGFVVENLDVLLNVACSSIFIIPAFERIVSSLHQLLFRSEGRIHSISG
jgi:hypothetical protein